MSLQEQVKWASNSEVKLPSPGALLVAGFLGVFFVVGWVVGRLWYGAWHGTRFLTATVQYGYARGAKVAPAKPAADQGNQTGDMGPRYVSGNTMAEPLGR